MRGLRIVPNSSIYNTIMLGFFKQIEEKIVHYKHLLDESKTAPSSKAIEKLMKMCYYSSKVTLTTISKGLTGRLSMVKDILQSCHRTCEYNLVYRIQSIINDLKIVLDHEMFRLMISLYVNLKNYKGALDMINKMKGFGILPKTSIYNTIMVGFFREGRYNEGLGILKEMDASHVKPDSYTFSFLIGHWNRETDIIEYYKKCKESGVQLTKHIFMALINAYAGHGMFEKAMEILSAKEIPQDDPDEIKNTLVSMLATSGQMADALKFYNELKQVDPKVNILITKHLDFTNELGRLIRIVEQLQDYEHWQNARANIILYCFRHKLLRGVDLLKKLMDKLGKNKSLPKLLFEEIFAQVTDTQFGLDLLQSIKGTILIQPSRKCHDFVLSTCFEDKNRQWSYNVWEEFKKSGLHYNSLSYLWICEILMAMGEKEDAQSLYKHIKDDGDLDVLHIAEICENRVGVAILDTIRNPT